MQAGLYEMLKYGVIRDQEVFDRAGNGDLSSLIARCCEIKAEVVAADEREAGLRQILNFGHTIGHALEAVTRYRRLKHGEAVGYGMSCAAMIATEIGICSRELSDAIGGRVAELGKLPRIDDLDEREVIAAMSHDKKVANGRLKFILPERIGSVLIRDDVPKQAIRKSVRRMLNSR
jgi:3-dehydroquinate synthase